jgi:hypothetical protein
MTMDDQSGWYPDPTGRHQERYFNAAGIPTNLIRNDGRESADEDRVASTATGSTDSRVIAQRIPAPASAPTPTAADRADPAPHANDTLPVPLARYSAPQPDASPDDPTGQVAAVPAEHPAPASGSRRSVPWLVATVCLLGVLVIGATLVAFQQHQQADKWSNDYHAQVSKNRTETHKSAGLFVSLLSAQHNLALVTFQKDAICQRLHTLLLHPDPTIEAACSG